MLLVSRSFGSSGLIILFTTKFWISSFETWGACCVETTTVSTRMGLLPSYSIVTWLFESGRSQSTSFFCRASVSLFRIRCDREIGSGISSGVSLQA